MEIPDDLFRQLKAKAALDGVTMRELINVIIRTGLKDSRPLRLAPQKRSKLPTIKCRGKGTIRSLSSELQEKLDAEEDLVRYARSTRR